MVHHRSRRRAGLVVASATPLLALTLAVPGAHAADEPQPDPRNTDTTLTTGGAPAPADLPDWVTIDNGTVMLGVWATGELNVPAAIPQPPEVFGTDVVGLRYLPTGFESTADGCLCEGWGVADATTGAYASANRAHGLPNNMTVESFTATADSATSTVIVSDDEGGDLLRVTHHYHPSATPNLYAVDVTLENLSEVPVDPRYRRVMDWDVQPTAFSEFSTIQGTAAAENVLFASNDGFASASPLAGPTDLGETGDFVDAGPADHGALFDFGFDAIAPGDDLQFTTFYGAAGTEDGADAALATVGAEIYSYGQPNVESGPTAGDPNTFIFAFAGVGGAPVFPAVAFDSASYSVNEGAGSATITAELSTPAEDSVTVDYATSDGTAAAPIDYTATSGTLTFPAGSTSQSFTVPIVDDAVIEPDETVNLTLTNPTGGAFLGTPAEAVLTIVDNDDESGPAVERIEGPDRYGTAAAISSTWAPGQEVVYIASGIDFPDAMPAGALGGTHDAPVLLTKPDNLPTSTTTELTRLQPERIVILGGPEAISESVATALADYAQADTDDEVTRVAGADRYATAAAAGLTYPAGVDVAYVATGADFPDALTSASAAGAADSPVLLTRPDHLPASTRAALEHLDPAQIVVMGGTEAVDDALITLLEDYTAGTVTRVSGADRYDTAALLSADLHAPGVNAVFVATGEVYADSMTGAPISVGIGGPIVLTQPDNLPATTIAELERLDPARIIVLGGPVAVSTEVETALAAYFG